MFIATVHREELDNAGSAEKSSQKIIELMQNDPAIIIADLARRVNTTKRAIKKQIGKMKTQGRIQRIDLDKGGRWPAAE